MMGAAPVRPILEYPLGGPGGGTTGGGGVDGRLKRGWRLGTRSSGTMYWGGCWTLWQARSG
jgi:hypothetical protein